MPKPKASQLVEVIHECKGNMTAIAESYGVPRSTVYGWVNTSEMAKQALTDARERFVDIAESKLFSKVEAGEDNAIFYTLNNSAEAKRRGWGPRQEIAHEGDLTIRVQYGELD